MSLAEVLVTLGIVGTVIGTAAPAAGDMVEAVRLSSASSDILGDLYLARMEALKRNRRVALCKSADGLQCSAAGGWEQGWIVFHDENNNGAVDPGEELISRHEPLPASLRLSGNQPVAKYISYTALGASKLTGGGFQAGTLTLCRRSAEPTPSRQLVLNSVGRPRVQRSTVPMCG